MMTEGHKSPARAEPAGAAPARPRQARTERARAAILRAAEREFRQQGFVAARMIDIAREAGISEKTLFNQFASKPALLEALTLRWFEARSTLFAEPESIVGDTIEEALPPDLDRRLDELGEHRWLLAMTAVHTNLFVTHRQPRELLARNFEARAHRVRKLQEQGIVRRDIPADEVCELYQALRNHLLGTWLAEDGGDFATLKKRFSRAMCLFLDGLRVGREGVLPRDPPVQRAAQKRPRKSVSSTR
jgi:AcrR family transcriptional regulator